MKHLTIILIGLLTFSFYQLTASHYMGGEITWKCRTNGKYDFYLKLYRECNGITYSNTETINTNYPGVPYIYMNLVSTTDLSPTCYSANPSIATIFCHPDPPVANTGAIDEWLYSSLASYPNGVTLSGVPPPSGWVFNYESCCRNPCTNINSADSYGWYLRAIMYPYQGRNANPCYDSSPQFAERPTTVITSGYPYCYNHLATDNDMDELGYTWAPPLDEGGLNDVITNYATGYSYYSPFPSTIHNINNIPASIDPVTGEICYLSYTTGAFVSVVKVTAYKCGVKVAEIFREIQTIITSDPYPIKNNPPQSIAPFYNAESGNFDLYTDTVTAGELVNFSITATDADKLQPANTITQTMRIRASGAQFASDFVNANNCSNPPCATLNPAVPVNGQSNVTTTFNWQTTCAHSNYCGIATNDTVTNYFFYFEVRDNACPAPAVRNLTIQIVVKPCHVGINENIFKFNNLNIYPNPISNLVNITNNGKSPSNFNLMVYNSLGNKIFQQQCHMQTSENIEINTSSWKSGVYLISIGNNKGIEYRKIIKL